MSREVSCPECKFSVSISDSDSGERVRCPKCFKQFSLHPESEGFIRESEGTLRELVQKLEVPSARYEAESWVERSCGILGLLCMVICFGFAALSVLSSLALASSTRSPLFGLSFIMALQWLIAGFTALVLFFAIRKALRYLRSTMNASAQQGEYLRRMMKAGE